MFWGVTLENGKRYSQVVNVPVHISMASLDPSTESSSGSTKAVSVMIDHEKSEFVLCTLVPGKVFQQPLDLHFAEGEEVTLFLNGQGTVHLTGYVDDSEPGLDGSDMEDSIEEDSTEEIEDAQLKALIRAKHMKEESLKRKAAEQSQRVASSKQLKKESEDEDDTSGESDEFEETDDEGSSDDEEVSDEDDSDEAGLFVQSTKKGKGQQQSSTGKGARPIAANQKQQGASSQRFSTPKTGQTPKKKQEQTPKAQGAPNLKNKPGQTPKKVPEQNSNKGSDQAVKKGPEQPLKKAQGQQQQQSSPKTPAVNGNESLNKSEGSKKRRRSRKGRNSESLNESPAAKVEGQKAATKTSDPQKLAGGIVVEELKTGNGPTAKAGKLMHVYYTGRLSNGNEFDSCKDGKPFKFRLGRSEVIKGWDIGLEGMKVGGTRKITVPPGQGYGNKSIGNIPPNSTLSFDVRLVAVS